MARDTRSPVPGETDDLRRVSLTSRHWRQARWLLGAEAVAAAVVGAMALVMLARGGSRPGDPAVAGIQVSWAVSFCLLGVAVATGVAVIRRQIALAVTATLCIAALVLVLVSAVAAAHHAHPLGSTLSVLLLWSVLFCYNFAVSIWLVPDHIEGPAWMPRRRTRGSAESGKLEGRR